MEVSDPDYEDMEHVDNRKRYATYFDGGIDTLEQSPTKYAFMGEALVNINRICDGLEVRILRPCSNDDMKGLAAAV